MPTTRFRLAAATVSLALVPALMSMTWQADAAPTTARGAQAAAPAPYSATITRTKYGVPHIVAKDFGSLGFGSGYAAAGSSICTLADTVLTGRGQRSR
jgi:acyl-homoserine-lactone acylase